MSCYKSMQIAISRHLARWWKFIWACIWACWPSCQLWLAFMNRRIQYISKCWSHISSCWWRLRALTRPNWNVERLTLRSSSWVCSICFCIQLSDWRLECEVPSFTNSSVTTRSSPKHPKGASIKQYYIIWDSTSKPSWNSSWLRKC
jgi:hypothetical protein